MSGDFPVIDIAAVRQPQLSAAERPEIVRQVASACEEIGFFAVTGHGVPGAVIADLVAQSYAFFDLPLAEKLAVRRPRPEQNRGYIAPGEERLARLRGDETPPDLKELYTIGPFDTPETPYFTGPAAYPSFAPNLWPARPVGLRPDPTRKRPPPFAANSLSPDFVNGIPDPTALGDNGTTMTFVQTDFLWSMVFRAHSQNEQ